MMEIDFAQFDDIDAIVRIEGECFMNEAWTREMIESDFFKRSIYIVTRNELGVPIAYLSMLDLEIEGEILRVAVKKQYRRKGVAKRMIRFLIEHLKANGYQQLYLEVKSTNEEAIKLYEHLGFMKFNERKHYYGSGEDALNYILLLD
ncbi:MAG: ribosomal protein S18-alanine N-acetyltransferase [Clostridia bacterium]|nr:ribosomal protein S18-alanine N-acetyltransferase [Clostridia bacterium]